MATVTYDNAQRLYPGAERPAVDDLNLEIADGEFLVLVGPSGCGKSTSLRMLAGLEEVTAGHIRIGDRDVTNLPPKERDIAMVFQNYALYPHMSVAENMAFSLKMAKVPKEERMERVKEAAKLLDLTEYLERKPKALSGGQRQRAGMGRAVVHLPHAPAPPPRPGAGGPLGPGTRPSPAGLLHARAAVEPRREASRVGAHTD